MFAFSEVTTGGVLHVGKLLYVLTYPLLVVSASLNLDQQSTAAWSCHCRLARLILRSEKCSDTSQARPSGARLGNMANNMPS